MIAKKAPNRFMILAPVVRDRKGEFTGLIENIQKKDIENFVLMALYMILRRIFILSRPINILLRLSLIHFLRKRDDARC